MREIKYIKENDIRGKYGKNVQFYQVFYLFHAFGKADAKKKIRKVHAHIKDIDGGLVELKELKRPKGMGK